MRSVTFFILTLTFCLSLASVVITNEDENEDWWKTAQLYQIYPRSFMDKIKDDGIGDLKGITSKLEHLHDIGVTAVWISPIFVSPMMDFGYDIADFYTIAEEYGTEEDLIELLNEAKKYGIRILLDYVPNHTSDQCEWFIKSVNKVEGYDDFYVWHEGKRNETGGRIPPSNWISVFRNSAWTWNEVRQQYYLHQFLPEQPDLNFRNPAVIEEMNNVVKFWLDKGVSGFRVDAIPHLVEADVNENGYYPDEPKSGFTDDPNDYNYLLHTETREREETWEIIRGWRKIVDDYSRVNKTETKVLLMEAMSEMDIVMQYYGNDTHPGAHFPFNFELTHLNSDANATTIKDRIVMWFDKVPEGRVTNWVAGNHDQSRLASRFTPERGDGVVMMTMLLPGVSVTYNGEEIGMTDQFLSYEDTKDPQACKDGPDMYHLTSRDPARTPFHWDSSKHAGFSNSNNGTWLPIADNYLELNLQKQNTSTSKNAYKLYKELSALRNTDIIKYGSFAIDTYTDNVLAFTRTYEKDVYVVMINTAATETTTDVSTKFDKLHETFEVQVSSELSNKNKGDKLNPHRIVLSRYESVVFSTRESAGSIPIVTPFYIFVAIAVVHAFFNQF